MTARFAAVLLCAVAAPVGVLAQPTGAPVTGVSAPPREGIQSPGTSRLPPGYLGSDRVPDAAAFLPPPPAPGSAADQADWAAYRGTRKLQGTARWAAATHDAELAPETLLADFACALGVRLDAASAPTLVRLIGRAGRDAGLTAAHAKEVYQRRRPFVQEPAATCVPASADLAKSWSYPSGHSTYGWTVGLVLAELAPDRAPAVLARAREYGESRVVCGVHWVSDVEQGRSNASSVVAVLHAEPAFAADMAAAKAEVTAARAMGPAPDAGQCRVEADTLGPVPWVKSK